MNRNIQSRLPWTPLAGFDNREDAAFSELAQCVVKKYRTHGMPAKPHVREAGDGGR